VLSNYDADAESAGDVERCRAGEVTGASERRCPAGWPGGVLAARGTTGAIGYDPERRRCNPDHRRGKK